MDSPGAAEGGIVLHSGRAYDLAFGWISRRSDGPILERAGVGPGDRVLDVGTGPGYLALTAARIVGSAGAAIGIDASPQMIDRARVRAARARSTARYQVASAAALPFADGSFDVVVSRLMLHHLTSELKKKALAEMFRVLRPGGRLLIADIASRAAREGHHRATAAGALRRSEDTIEAFVCDAGFRDLTHGPLTHGFLAGVAARRPGNQGERERSRE